MRSALAQPALHFRQLRPDRSVVDGTADLHDQSTQKIRVGTQVQDYRPAGSAGQTSSKTGLLLLGQRRRGGHLGSDDSLPVVYCPDVIVEDLVEVANSIVAQENAQEVRRRRVDGVSSNQVPEYQLLCIARTRRTVENIEQLGNTSENLAKGGKIFGYLLLLAFLHHDVRQGARVARKERRRDHCFAPSLVTNRMNRRSRSSSVISRRIPSSARRTDNSAACALSSIWAVRVRPSISWRALSTILSASRCASVRRRWYSSCASFSAAASRCRSSSSRWLICDSISASLASASSRAFRAAASCS